MPKAEPMTVLPESMFQVLQKETFALLHTRDAETGGPTSSAISWIIAVDPARLRFAVDARSRLVGNLKACPETCLTLFGDNKVYAVYGTADLWTERLEGVPFALAGIDVEIREVRDAMFYGARLTSLPEYEKIYDKRAADRLDQQVFEALRKKAAHQSNS